MRIVTALILPLSLGVGAVCGHHSLPALFDTSSTIAVTGEVTEFEFVAPHAYIHLNVADEAGGQTAWEIETYPPGMLVRQGLTPAVIKPGDEISVRGHPTRDGRPLMRLLFITLSDGEERQVQ